MSHYFSATILIKLLLFTKFYYLQRDEFDLIKVRLYDTRARIILEENVYITQNEGNVRLGIDLPRGIYFITVTSDLNDGQISCQIKS